MICFTVRGVAEPKARPRSRIVRSGEKQWVQTYTPKATRRWEEVIREVALQHAPAQLLAGPLALEATFYLPRPPSKPKRVRYPDVKPDWDNLAKSVSDALEGLFYARDSQFVDVAIRKRYGDPPRVEISIGPLEVPHAAPDTPAP